MLVPWALDQALKKGSVVLVRFDEETRQLDPHKGPGIEMNNFISDKRQCHGSKVLRFDHKPTTARKYGSSFLLSASRWLTT